MVPNLQERSAPKNQKLETPQKHDSDEIPTPPVVPNPSDQDAEPIATEVEDVDPGEEENSSDGDGGMSQDGAEE